MNLKSFHQFILSIVLIVTVSSLNCSAVGSQQTEEQALQNLRQLMKSGRLPAETVVQQIESRFPNTKTAALCKLLRAQIRLNSKDYNGAVGILNANIFSEKTTVGDYALWLRGKALLEIGNKGEAQRVFEQLVNEFPDSLRIRESKLLWANSITGQPERVLEFLQDLISQGDAEALLAAAKAFEAQGNQEEAIKYYRRAYFYGAGSTAGKEAAGKLISPLSPSSNTNADDALSAITPQNEEEAQIRANKLFAAGKYADAQKAFDSLLSSFPKAATSANQLKRVSLYVSLKRFSEAQTVLNLIPLNAPEKPEAFANLVRGYANSRMWSQVRTTIDEMRRSLPNAPLTPTAIIDAGMIARDQKNKSEETYLLQLGLNNYPKAIDVAQAQFELAWMQHEAKNFALSSQMLTEHLGRYADQDTSYRGRAGYWSARDSERAGKINEACVLYDAVIYRYNANWYGYIAQQRLASLKATGKCKNVPNFPADSMVARAAANLKTVTVAPETSTAKEEVRFGKAEQLSIVGLFNWAVEELDSAAKTAPNSPKVNLAIARLYRLRGDNVSALLALARSYPDYSQMFPEEMGREEWDIFYPLTDWFQIKLWANNRNLDPYQVAGLIRQESVFNPRAKSRANAYGLMQLLVPTARLMARKYGTEASITGESLFQPALNIELGTAYMKDQLEKFGRIEFMAVAYNAGPGRVSQWQNSLPWEMDEFVEAIPFRETRGYVQGIIRNSAQYRRLYDENGNFKANVGSNPVRNAIDTQTRDRIAQDFPDVKIDESRNSGE